MKRLKISVGLAATIWLGVFGLAQAVDSQIVLEPGDTIVISPHNCTLMASPHGDSFSVTCSGSALTPTPCAGPCQWSSTPTSTPAPTLTLTPSPTAPPPPGIIYPTVMPTRLPMRLMVPLIGAP